MGWRNSENHSKQVHALDRARKYTVDSTIGLMDKLADMR